MDGAVARIRDQAPERRLAWCLAVLQEHWLAWRRQIVWAGHLRHGSWGWLVTAPHRQDLRRSSTKAVMRLGYTDGSFHGCEFRLVDGFRYCHRRMRHSVRTRLLRDRTGRGRAETSQPTRGRPCASSGRVNVKQHRAPLLACRNAGGPARQDGNSMNSRS
jgi:hypothetical protein